MEKLVQSAIFDSLIQDRRELKVRAYDRSSFNDARTSILGRNHFLSGKLLMESRSFSGGKNEEK